MPRLPTPDGDAGSWGTILNEYLLVEHDADGTLRPDGSLPAIIAAHDDVVANTSARHTHSNKALLDGITSERLLPGGISYVTGAGMPNGVVSALPGSTYIDTNATCGAVQWTKMTGTGTTGWKVTIGDTGQILLAKVTAGGVWTTASGITKGEGLVQYNEFAGYVNIQRINDLIIFSMQTVRIESGTKLTGIPTGFHFATAPMSQGAATATYGVNMLSGTLNMPNTSIVGANGPSRAIAYAPQDWPTFIPTSAE